MTDMIFSGRSDRNILKSFMVMVAQFCEYIKKL